MIKHIFKLIWNKKGSNALMLLEIFLSFLVLFAVVGYVLYNVTNIKTPIGFETEDRTLKINLVLKSCPICFLQTMISMR